MGGYWSARAFGSSRKVFPNWVKRGSLAWYDSTVFEDCRIYLVDKLVMEPFTKIWPWVYEM
jgi:hypothetical protein